MTARYKPLRDSPDALDWVVKKIEQEFHVIPSSDDLDQSSSPVDQGLAEAEDSSWDSVNDGPFEEDQSRWCWETVNGKNRCRYVLSSVAAAIGLMFMVSALMCTDEHKTIYLLVSAFGAWIWSGLEFLGIRLSGICIRSYTETRSVQRAVKVGSSPR